MRRRLSNCFLLILLSGVFSSLVSGAENIDPSLVAFQKDGIIRIFLDPASLSKPESIKYIRCELWDSQNNHWQAVGNFKLKRNKRGAVTYGEFPYNAKNEGVYSFRSVAVSSRHDEEKKLNNDPDVVVVVDTTPPQISLSENTARPTAYAAGDELRMEWTAADAGSLSGLRGDAYVSISLDGGDTWPKRFRQMKASHGETGNYYITWKIPPMNDLVPGPLDTLKELHVVAVRVQMADRAGNIGIAQSRMFSIADPGSDLFPQAGDLQARLKHVKPDDKTTATQKTQEKAQLTAKRRAHFQRGYIYLTREDYDEASSEFKLALENDPAYAPAVANLAISEFFDGRRNQAIMRLDSSLKKKEFIHNIQLSVTFGWLLMERLGKNDYDLAWMVLSQLDYETPETDAEKRLLLKGRMLMATLAEKSKQIKTARQLWHSIYRQAPTGSSLRNRAAERLRLLKPLASKP